MSGEPKREARDRYVVPPSAADRALAAKLGVDVYDGRRAAQEAGLPQLQPNPQRAWLARFRLW